MPLSGHWLLYGTHDGERVDTLGLVRGNEPLSPTHQDALACFVAEHALVLVDWCRHTSVDPNTQSLRAILG